jgi:hypothetical protein
MDLTNWFDVEIIAEKREQIATTIKTLISREGELPPLPPISFKSDPEVECVVLETNIDNNNEEAFNNNNDFNVQDNNKVNDVSVEIVNDGALQGPTQPTEYPPGLIIEPIDIKLALQIMTEKMCGNRSETNAQHNQNENLAPASEEPNPLEHSDVDLFAVGEPHEMEVDDDEPASNNRCESTMDVDMVPTCNSELKAPENDAQDVIERMKPEAVITAVIDLDSE